MDIIEDDIRLFQNTIRDYSSYDFNDYSTKSLRRRLTKILQEKDMDMIELTRELRNNSIFLEEIVKKITVTTTELFRDPEVWKHLRNDVFPGFEKKDSINIWHPGCSTGQEVYTSLILLDDAGLLEKSNIYASDLNSDVLALAKEGRYNYRFNKNYIENFDKTLNYSYNDEEKIRDISWNKYFTIDRARDNFQMKEFLLKKPVYNKIDLVKDSNHFFVNFDLIICRNVIIYFNYDLQNRVFDLFYKSLKEKGCLFLGFHESILGPFSNRFIKNDQFYFKN